MVDAVDTTVYSYASQLLASEDGPWDNDSVSYTYSNRLRSGLTLVQPNASPLSQSYGYDAANRLQTLSSQPARSHTPIKPLAISLPIWPCRMRPPSPTP